MSKTNDVNRYSWIQCLTQVPYHNRNWTSLSMTYSSILIKSETTINECWQPYSHVSVSNIHYYKVSPTSFSTVSHWFLYISCLTSDHPASLLSCSAYDEYIKHYPLAEACHRSELQHNTKYQYFLSECSKDPRVRKRDLTTFISRPVTRLPRINLILQNALKHTEPDHPDVDALGLLIELISGLLQSAQPGIDASEKKVQFCNLCENLVYQKGEIIVSVSYNPLYSFV